MKRLAFILGFLLLCVSLVCYAEAVTGPSGVLTGNCSALVTSSPDVPCWDTIKHQWNYWSAGANSIEPVAVNGTANPGVPSGADIIMSSGVACPAGYTEDTTLAGFYLIPRPLGGKVGGSLGAAVSGSAAPADASYTPTGINTAITAGTPVGTVSTPIFTGSLTTASATTSTPKLVVGNTAAGVAVQMTAAGTISPPIFIGSVLSAHTHAFTGTTNTTMRSTIAPGIYVLLCKKS